MLVSWFDMDMAKVFSWSVNMLNWVLVNMIDNGGSLLNDLNGWLMNMMTMMTMMGLVSMDVMDWLDMNVFSMMMYWSSVLDKILDDLLISLIDNFWLLH